MSKHLTKHEKHRRWMGLYWALEQQKNALKRKPWLSEEQYDRCYNLGFCYELVDKRRKMRTGERYKHKGEWFGNDG